MSDRPSLRIVAVGDLAFNARYHRLLERRGPDWPVRPVRPEWDGADDGADLRLGNLESPPTTAPRIIPSKLSLRGAVRSVDGLDAAGFDCVSLANNHAMDFGLPGLVETMQRLDKAGILHHGAGENEAAALRPVVVRRRGLTVGLLAFCDVEQPDFLYAGPAQPGVARFDVDAACRSVHALKADVDWVILQLHWGSEMSRLPRPDHRVAARRLIEAGADLILGHHPHVLQPLEWIDGVPVFYSLGNFLFSGAYWRGRNEAGERFSSKMRIHDLSCETGWADVVLQKGAPTRAHLRPARLGHDLAVRPEETPGRADDWDRLCGRLDLPDYPAELEAEFRLSAARLRACHETRNLLNRIELKLFHHGLMPFAVVEG
jgi:poly-gamma-glutamate capsule biosynthesis protein CapA/YwtB (metallophosphatase superfamily)